MTCVCWYQLFMELLTQESMEKKLFEWVDAAVLPMCVYAEGLLALALLDDQVPTTPTPRTICQLPTDLLSISSLPLGSLARALSRLGPAFAGDGLNLAQCTRSISH